MPICAHVTHDQEGAIVVIQSQEYRCQGCNRLLMKAIVAAMVKKSQPWDVQIKCHKCKEISYFKLK